MNPDPPAWHEHAACRDHDVDMWFPGPHDDYIRAKAKAICRQCPVRRECLDTALANGERYGIWGGVSIASYVRDERRGRNRRTVA